MSATQVATRDACQLRLAKAQPFGFRGEPRRGGRASAGTEIRGSCSDLGFVSWSLVAPRVPPVSALAGVKLDLWQVRKIVLNHLIAAVWLLGMFSDISLYNRGPLSARCW